jgi:hypothetical protein
VAGSSGGLGRIELALQETFELPAVDSEGRGRELGKGRGSRVLVDKAILHTGLESLVELTGEGFVVPLDETPDTTEVREIGRDGGGLVEIAEFSLLRPHDIWIPERFLQGFSESAEGLELQWDFWVSLSCFRVLIQERLEPVERRTVEVTRSEEDLLGLVGEEFGPAEEVVSAFREKHVQLVPVTGIHIGRRHLRGAGLRAWLGSLMRGWAEDWRRLRCDRRSGSVEWDKTVHR